MKIRNILIIALVAALPQIASAQSYTIPVSDLETDLGARLELSIDKKITKGLHVEAFTEGRMTDNFGNLSRVDAGLGVSYKVNDYLKLGTGYIMINKESSSGTWKMRHRAYFDATGTLHADDWRFSLKERIQLTHKDVNTVKHQTTPNSLELKSRIKVAYKAIQHLEPYGYVEMRNVFNDPSCTATWSSATETFGYYSFTGYNHAYINRLRGCIGAEYKLDRHNSLDLHILADYCKDKTIDTYSGGTNLRSLYWQPSFNTAICLGYTFSF